MVLKIHEYSKRNTKTCNQKRKRSVKDYFSKREQILRKRSVKDYFSKREQILRKLQIRSHLLRKSLTES